MGDTKECSPSSRPNCLRTGNDETMNANYDLDDQWTLTDVKSRQNKSPVRFSLCGFK